MGGCDISVYVCVRKVVYAGRRVHCWPLSLESRPRLQATWAHVDGASARVHDFYDRLRLFSSSVVVFAVVLGPALSGLEFHREVLPSLASRSISVQLLTLQYH